MKWPGNVPQGFAKMHFLISGGQNWQIFRHLQIHITFTNRNFDLLGNHICICIWFFSNSEVMYQTVLWQCPVLHIISEFGFYPAP